MVTDTFGVRSLLRPIGARAPAADWSCGSRLPAPRRPRHGCHASRTCSSCRRRRACHGGAAARAGAAHARRDGESRLGDRTQLESPIERTLQQARAPRPDAAAETPAGLAIGCRDVPDNWIPLLPVQLRPIRVRSFG